ncbi:MAG TPA: hypothetical protein VFZ85_12355 [Jiangellaceae bacterium]
MTVVVASMVVITLTAVAVLLAVFGMHLITRSPRVRRRVRRGAFAVGTTAYAVRWEVAKRLWLAGRYVRKHVGQPASRAWRTVEPMVERTGQELAERVTERARALIAGVKSGIGYVRATAPHSGRPAGPGSARVPAAAMLGEPPGDRPGRRHRSDGPSTEQAAR